MSRSRKNRIELSPPRAKRTRQSVDVDVTDSVDANIAATISKEIKEQISSLGKTLAVSLADQMKEIVNQKLTEIPQADSASKEATASTSQMLQGDIRGGSDPSDVTGSLLDNNEGNNVTDDQTLRQVLQSVLGEQSMTGEQSNLEMLCSDELPLGVNLPEKTLIRIKQGEYVDLATVLNPSEDHQTIVVNSIQGQPSINFKRSNNTKLYNIDQWTDAMLVYGSIYLVAQPDQTAQFFKYIEFIRTMSKSSSNWLTYDELFRKIREKQHRNWDKPLLIPYINSIKGQGFTSPKSTIQNRQKGQNFRSRTPQGCCYSFHDFAKCDRDPCRFSHKCPICSQLHPRIRCKSQNFQKQSQQSKKSSPM